MRVSHFKLRLRLLMAIFSSAAVQCGYFRTNDVMLARVYVGLIYFLQISELASMKQPKDSLQLAKPIRNSRKIANKLTTVASGEINMQSKHNLVSHGCESESFNVSAFHGCRNTFLMYLIFP